MRSEPIYREEQRFRQPWLWMVLGGVCLAQAGGFGYGMVQQLVFGKTWGDRPLSNPALLLVGTSVLVSSVGMLLLFLKMRLLTEVRDDGLHLRYIPFHFKFHRIGAEELEGWEAATYSPLWDYGGWGIKYGPRGKVYNVSGNRGVQLELKSGKRLMIGSQRPEELAEALDRITARR